MCCGGLEGSALEVDVTGSDDGEATAWTACEAKEGRGTLEMEMKDHVEGRAWK